MAYNFGNPAETLSSELSQLHRFLERQDKEIEELDAHIGEMNKRRARYQQERVDLVATIEEFESAIKSFEDKEVIKD